MYDITVTLRDNGKLCKHRVSGLVDLKAVFEELWDIDEGRIVYIVIWQDGVHFMSKGPEASKVVAA